MIERTRITLNSEENMRKAGISLGKSLYGNKTTILLSGPLGAGKSTLVRGLAEGLGVRQAVTSPTYALEQRYDTPKGPLIHIDLYRLSDADAAAFLRSVEHERGVLCVEWAEKIAAADRPEDAIAIACAEDGQGRSVDIAFDDAPLPSREDVLAWRAEFALPPHIGAHCDATADLCQRIAGHLLKHGCVVRPLALRRAAEAHDLLRTIDMRPGAGPAGWHWTPDEERTWAATKERFAGLKHEPAAARLLRERGYAAVAEIVETHGLTLPPADRRTVEQQILFYADKRTMMDATVTLDERFADFARRYGAGKPMEDAALWLAEARRAETALFGGPPAF